MAPPGERVEPDPSFLPPNLTLDADDVIDAVEIVAEPDPDDDDGDGDDPNPLYGAADPVEHRGPERPEVERVSGFDGVGTRRESRERALALLYEAEQRAISPMAAVLDGLPVAPEAFAAELVVGVSDHQSGIDRAIDARSVGWPLERMPAIDRALLRLGIYELTETDVPTGAAISEAVELAKRYSTDDSHKFINGILAAVAAEARS